MKKIHLLVYCTLFLVPFTFSQNVGIGTPTPAFKLDVKNGSINTDSLYRIGGSKVLSANLQNTFVGIGAANSITTGNYNTAVGFESLYSNTTGERNTAFGLCSLRSNIIGNYNTAIGKSALHVNSFGSFNTANGYEALYYNTVGQYNTAHGYQSLLFNTIGAANTANGSGTLHHNTTGISNTGLGYQSLFSNTSGQRNAATGNQALYYNSTGEYNTANGFRALFLNTSGIFNTAVGTQALFTNTTGNHNTALGVFADVYTEGLSNSTVIGYSAIVDASNKVRIGNATVTSIGGQVGWSTFSDGRYKRNIQDNVPGISFINKLRPITYNVDTKSLDENYYKIKPGMAAAANTSYRHTGFIAQEVENSAAELGFNFSGVDKPQLQGNLYGLRYAEFVVPLVKAVQELSKENDELKRQSVMQKKQNEDLLKRVEKIESLINLKK